MTKIVRSEFRLHDEYQFQLFYEYSMSIKNGKENPEIVKSKNKAVFENINNLSEEYLKILKQKNIKLQKCNVINDMNNNKVLLILLKSEKELEVKQINT